MAAEFAQPAALASDRDAWTASAARIAAALEKTRRPFSEAHTLPGEVYSSQDIFQLEQRGLFARQWLCVGREADLPARGDYLLKEVAGDSILLIRGNDDRIRAFYNVCRHRGSRLLDAPSGHRLTRVLCPYHAWSYNLDGTLQAAPQMGEDFRKDESALVAVRIGLFQGFIFLNLDQGAAPLERYLADLPDFARFRMAELVCGKRVEYDVAANWKLICENYSECYHCPGAHPQLARLSDLIARHERRQEIGACFNGGPMRLREGVQTMSMSGRSTLPTIPGLTHDDCRFVYYYVIYPNLLLSPHPDYVLTHTAWPVAPGRTRVVCEWLFTEEAVADSKLDPSDVVDFWDTTNRQDWALCERTQAGVSSHGFRPGPYQPSEDCVHTFDRWYADQIAALL